MPFAAALQPAPLAGSSSLDVPPHVLGVVFPGYHRDEFNDLMWGRGYTEWWRVGIGKALIPGQHQPQLPRDQYDLSESSTLQDMAAMAHGHGIDSLLLYHYWYQDAPSIVPGLTTKRILRKPLDTLLAHPEINTSFALTYADFDMTKKAQGFDIPGAKERNAHTGATLMHANHSRKDDYEHALWLSRNVFADPRYLRVDGKPLFAFFSSSSQGYRLEFLSTLRATARECCGLE